MNPQKVNIYIYVYMTSKIMISEGSIPGAAFVHGKLLECLTSFGKVPEKYVYLESDPQNTPKRARSLGRLLW